MRQELRMKSRRVISGVLAFTMVSILVLGDAGVAMASEYGDRFYQGGNGLAGEDDLDTVSAKTKFKNIKEKDISISVIASEDSDFRSGGEVYLDVNIKNESGGVITDGTLSFEGRKLKKAGAYFEELEEDPVTEGIMPKGEQDGYEEEDAEEGTLLINDLENGEGQEESESRTAATAEQGEPETEESQAGTENGERETVGQAEEGKEQVAQDIEIRGTETENIEIEDPETESTETENRETEVSETEETTPDILLETEEALEGQEDWEEEEDNVRVEIEAGQSRRKKEKEAKADSGEEDEEESLLQEIEDIHLAPGQIYTARFVYTVDESIEKAKNQKVTFQFAGKNAKDKEVKQKETFYYTANYLNVDKVNFEDGNRVLTGEEVTMGIRTSMYDFDALLADTEVEEELASRSNAKLASSSNADKATASNADVVEDEEEEEEDEEEEDEGELVVDLGNTSYRIEMINAKLNGFKARKALVDDATENLLLCTFRVSSDVKPGIYFGRVTQESKVKGRTFKSSQGFALIVTGEGEIELTGGIPGAEVQVKGKAGAFPEGDVLSLKVSEVPAEKREMVQAALEQKAQETGISVNKLRALDIKVIADGREKELDDEVTVTFSNVELEPLEEFVAVAEETEEEVEEVEEGFSFFGLRRMSRARSAEAEPAALSDEAAGNVSEEEGEGDSTIAVWHLDESAGVLNDMNGWVNDEGDVVMDTNHFSIYIVVDMEQLGGNVALTVEHWGQNIGTINADGTTDPYFIMLDRSTENSDSGRWYGYHTKDEVYDRHTKQIVRTNYNGQLYTPDTIMLSNKTRYESIEELSKVCLVTAKKEYAEKNYELGEIWISSNLSNQGKATWAEWASPKTKITVTRDGNGNITNTEGVTLKANSVIRFVYKEKGVASDYYQPVTFYDYNVTSGGKGATVAATPTGSNQGTNKSSNFTGGSNKMGVGQDSSGNKSTPWNNAHTNVSGLKGYLNKGNNAKGNSAGIVYDDDVPDKTEHVTSGNLTDDSLISAVVKNEVLENLTDDYKLQFHPSISQPGFFEEKSGTKKFTNYKLGFQQKGDTYILSTVQRNGKTVLSNLETIRYSAHNFKNDSNIYSNDFWPLDKEQYNKTSYSFADPQATGQSDGGGTHNWHFGMHYAFTFSVGDYTGPMNFYFRGDDDFWLFVDGKRAVDLGGIHFAVGQAIDMRQWLEEHGGVEGEHRIDIYYMERGGFGSCCYMQFTLPNCIPVDSQKNPQTQVTVKKEWNDYNNPNRPSDIDITLWQMHNKIRVDKGTVTLSEANNWQYTWTELPVSDPNDVTLKYTYEVIEKNVPPGYDSQTIHTTGSDANGWVITVENKLDPEVKVKITKQWEDNNDKCSNRPEQLRFQLYADGKALAGKILTLNKLNQVGNNSNVWSGEFEHLPKYRYEKDASGNFIKDTNGNYKAVEIVYTVKELKGNTAIEEGSSFNGNHGSYKVTYANALTDNEKKDNYVAHVKVTNTHTCEVINRKVIKEWEGIPSNSAITATAKIGLYYKKGTGWEKVTTDINNKALENPITLSWPVGTGGQEARWANLPKYAGNNEITYGIFEVDSDERPVINSNSEIILGDYKYKVTFADAEAETVTITNELMKARLRVGKWVDNQTVSDDVMEDEFIITVVSEEKAAKGESPEFETGVVLLPAGHGSAVNENTLDGSRLSKYIEVPVKAVGSNYVIGEKTDLKEYTPSKVFVTKYSGTGNLKGTVITVMPGGDDVVLVHNTFNHEDYFHNDHSVTNQFNGSDAKPGNNSAQHMVSLDATVPERKTYDELEWAGEDIRLT